jgi:hypothetical protein
MSGLPRLARALDVADGMAPMSECVGAIEKYRKSVPSMK